MTAVALDPQANARAELARRELLRRSDVALRTDARRSMSDFCAWTDPDYDPALPHAKLICKYLDALVRREIENLAICMPPRYGKSYHVSQRMPAYALGVSGGRKLVATASYTIDVARKNSRAVRSLVSDPRYPFPGIHLAPGAQSVTEWYTTAGGGMKAAGVDGPLTGFGAHILDVDDPFKGPAEANSPGIRDSVWSWWQDVVSTRQQRQAQKQIATTRWHDDDLVGRLMNTGAARHWTILELRAIAEEDDILGRAVGELLWPDGPPLPSIADGEISTRSFSALYQQHPTPDAGSLFMRPWLVKRYRELPSDLKRGNVFLDGAWKDGVGNDRSAMALWLTNGIDYFVADAFAGRMEYPDLKAKVAAFWDRHKRAAPTMKCCVEDAASGIPLIQEFARSTSIPIIGVKVDKSKYVRAEAVTPEFESGKVYLPEGASWVDEWVEEHVSFPTAKHDDYVDTSSGGLGQLKNSNRTVHVEVI